MCSSPYVCLCSTPKLHLTLTKFGKIYNVLITCTWVSAVIVHFLNIAYTHDPGIRWLHTMAMLKSLFPTHLPWSSPNEAKFISKQLSLPDKPLPAKSIPLLILNNTTYSPEESTLHCRKCKIHLSIVQISCLPCTSMAIVLCKACPALAVTFTSYLALIG